MNTTIIVKLIGVVLVCIGIHFGLTSLLPLIVFGVGLGLIVLPIPINS